MHPDLPGRLQTVKRRPIGRVDQRTLDLLASVDRERLGEDLVNYAGLP